MFSMASDDEMRGLYWFLADYHGGQASRGYRLLCKTGRALRRRYDTRDPMGMSLGVKGTRVYDQLVQKYVNKV